MVVFKLRSFSTIHLSTVFAYTSRLLGTKHSSIQLVEAVSADELLRRTHGSRKNHFWSDTCFVHCTCGQTYAIINQILSVGQLLTAALYMYMRSSGSSSLLESCIGKRKLRRIWLLTEGFYETSLNASHAHDMWYAHSVVCLEGCFSTSLTLAFSLPLAWCVLIRLAFQQLLSTNHPIV